MSAEKLEYEAYDSQEMWELQGRCQVEGVPTEFFYPNNSAGVERAVKFCSSCAVKSACLEQALSRPENFGVWGGASERDRRRMRKLRRGK